ncbi:hypothetical protein [Streptomyces sp. NPDC002763]
MSALFVHKAAAGAASSTIASGHVAFAAADLAVVVGDVRPRTARRDGRKD